MNEIYVVVGDSGEYSDHSEWLVAWFSDKAEAEEFAGVCQKHVNDLIEAGWTGSHKSNEKFPDARKYDPQARLISGEIEYCVAAVPKAVWKQLPGVTS